MYHIQIVGAGYTGTRIARHFRDKKQKVWTVSRSAQKSSEDGITAVRADLTKPESLEKIPPAHFIVLCPAPDTRSESDYRSVYLEGIGNYLSSLKNKPRPNFILYLSSTAVWKEREGEWVDETAPADADSARGRILIDAERQVLECGLPSAVFRLSGIYGPGRNRFEALKAGTWPENPANGWMNLIHVDDIVQAVPVLFKSGKEGEVYTGVDDEPVLKSELYLWLAEKTGIQPRFNFDGPAGGKRCRNGKLKSLGFKPLYPSFREGYLSFLKENP
jgi:nucleoside-diphosphate-sugar epimerase